MKTTITCSSLVTTTTNSEYCCGRWNSFLVIIFTTIRLGTHRWWTGCGNITGCPAQCRLSGEAEHSAGWRRGGGKVCTIFFLRRRRVREGVPADQNVSTIFTRTLLLSFIIVIIMIITRERTEKLVSTCVKEHSTIYNNTKCNIVQYIQCNTVQYNIL